MSSLKARKLIALRRASKNTSTITTKTVKNDNPFDFVNDMLAKIKKKRYQG